MSEAERNEARARWNEVWEVVSTISARDTWLAENEAHPKWEQRKSATDALQGRLGELLDGFAEWLGTDDLCELLSAALESRLNAFGYWRDGVESA